MSNKPEERFKQWNKARDRFELSWCSNESLLLATIPANLEALKEFAWHVWQHATSAAALAATPDGGELLREFANKLEAAIKARDFSDGWHPLNVQQSCSEMVHEVLEDEMHVSAKADGGELREALLLVDKVREIRLPCYLHTDYQCECNRQLDEDVLPRLRAALSATTSKTAGTLGLEDTKRDWETDGPAWEKRAREAEAKLADGAKLLQQMAKAMYAVHRRLEFYTEREVNSPANHQEFARQAREELDDFNLALTEYNEWAKVALLARAKEAPAVNYIPNGGFAVRAMAGASAETPSHIVAQQMREVAANQGIVGTSELLVWADMLERNRQVADKPLEPPAPSEAQFLESIQSYLVEGIYPAYSQAERVESAKELIRIRLDRLRPKPLAIPFSNPTGKLTPEILKAAQEKVQKLLSAEPPAKEKP